MNTSTETAETQCEKIRTLIVEDHEIMAIGTKQVLEKQLPCLKPIEIALNAEVARKLVKDKPVLIIMDIDLGARQQPSANGRDLANEFFSTSGESKILFYTSYDNSRVLYSVEKNVKGHVLKNSLIEVFSRAVRIIMDGGTYYDPNLRPKYNPNLPPESKIAPTDKEEEFLKIYVRGYTENHQIAKIMFVKEVTVRAHRKNISEKYSAPRVVDQEKRAINDIELKELAETLYPLPDEELTEKYKKILGCWYRLEGLLQKKYVHIIKSQAAQDFLERACNTKDKNLFRIVIDSIDKLEDIENLDNKSENKESLDKLENFMYPNTALSILEIKYKIISKNQDREGTKFDEENLYEKVKKDKRFLQLCEQRELTENEIDKIVKKIKEIEKSVLMDAFCRGVPMPDLEKLYKGSKENLEAESTKSFNEEDIKTLLKFLKMILNKKEDQDSITAILGELGTLYNQIGDDNAAKTCSDFVQLINKM